MNYHFVYGRQVVSLPAAALPLLGRADATALRVLIALAAAPGTADGASPTRETLAEIAGCTSEQVDQALSFWHGAGILEAENAATGTKPARKRSKSTTAGRGAEHVTGEVACEIAHQAADADTGKAAQASADTPAAITPGGSDIITSAASAPPAASAAPRVVNSASAGQTPRPIADLSALPRYTITELTALLESRRELSALIDECSRVCGKILNTHEINILLGLLDYLNLDGDYLLLLLAYCTKIGKNNLRYAEKLTLSLYDDGITDVSTLQEYLKRREEREQVEGQIRRLFGMSSRALTTKEKKMIDAWLFTYHYGMDIITRAYEITVNATGNASVPYANSIMERWAAAGLHTLAEIEAADSPEQRVTDAQKIAPGKSFDIDDFFNAALRRSFGDDYIPVPPSNPGNQKKR